MDGVAMLDIDEAENKIFIGVVDQQATRTVGGLIAAQQVPEDAVLVEIRDRPVRAQELTDHERPVKAGFLIENEASEWHRCTLGFNAVQSGRVFVTASHCSELESQLDYSVEFQNDDVAGMEIGYETYDVEPYRCSAIPVPCRFADASTFTYYGSVNDRKGYIARTMYYGVNEAGSRLVDPSNPEFPIRYKSGTVLVGYWLNKVGRRTGWTRGPVTRTCVWNIYTEPPAWYRCQNEVDLYMLGGDSGSPVFLAGGITGTWNESLSDANLVGVISGYSTSDSLMYYSQMNYIEYELGSFNVWAPSPPPPMTVTINGPDTWPAYQQVTVQALVSYGTPPFTYVWQVNGSPACSGQSWCSYNMGAPYTSAYFYVTVPDADQDQASDYHVVIAQWVPEWSGETNDPGGSMSNNSTLLLLSMIALLASGVACVTDVVAYELKPGILEDIDIPVDVTVPDTVAVDNPAEVVVRTIGGGCIRAKAHDDVSIEGLQVVIQPYDSMYVGYPTCRGDLILFRHVVEVVFGQRGTATVRVLGRFGETDSSVTVERTIVVN
jgi:hypothetical protein